MGYKKYETKTMQVKQILVPYICFFIICLIPGFWMIMIWGQMDAGWKHESEVEKTMLTILILVTMVAQFLYWIYFFNKLLWIS